MNGYSPPAFSAPVDLDLSKNEGRPSVDTVDLDRETIAALTSRYPDTNRLSGLIGERHGLPSDRVLVTAGGDDALLRCFLRIEGSVVTTTPSFEMISRYAGQVGVLVDEVPWWDEDFPLEEYLASEADVAVIVSPNNPTGNVLSSDDLREVAARFALVVVDAAYAEFAEDDLSPVALEYDNVVVIRTLSKAFGLAGLRVGYLLGPADVVTDLKGLGSPYSLSGLSAALAADVLEQGMSGAEEFAAVVVDERARLTRLLSELGAGPISSQANFVLATSVSPRWVVPAAASLGVGLRQFPDRPDLGRCVRIGLPGAPSEYERLERTLRTVLKPEAILFDMDGVLADVRLSFRAAIVATAAQFGVEVSQRDIAVAKAAGNASDDWELTRALCGAAGVEVTFGEVRDSFERIYQGCDGAEGLKMREELLVDRELLATWAERFPMGVVTARPRKDAVEFLERFDIARYFTTVVTREDAPAKPDPAPVRLALQRLEVSRAWMAGDTRDDLEAARRAGVVPIGVMVDGYEPNSLSIAARIIASVNEIEEILNETQS